jgi:DNA-directed RNA polymerase specialized sigma24 family protein
MSSSINAEVFEDDDLKTFIGIQANKLARRFPSTLDREDAEQELWEAVIKAMPKYDGSTTFLMFAKSAAQSKYGHLIDGRYRKLPFNETFVRFDPNSIDSDDPVYQKIVHKYFEYDEGFEAVEVSDALDRIEESLKVEAEKAAQYVIAFRWFRLLRRGFSTQEAATRLKVSTNYLYVIRNRIFNAENVRNLTLIR